MNRLPIEFISQRGICQILPHSASWPVFFEFLTHTKNKTTKPAAYSVKCIKWDNSIVNHPQAFVMDPPEVYFFYDYLFQIYEQTSSQTYSAVMVEMLGKLGKYHMVNRRYTYPQIIQHTAATHGPLAKQEFTYYGNSRLAELLNLRAEFGQFGQVKATVPDGTVIEPLCMSGQYFLLSNQQYRILSEKEAFTQRLKYGH